MDTPLETGRRRRKLIILAFGVAIYFLSSMAKVLVPATIFAELQTELHLLPERIAALGAAFMYAYAASQLLAGIFADRYGGVRILLIGGTLFATGIIGFPYSSPYLLMIFFRILAGFGAGTVFLGVAKLLSDLFDRRFTLAMGLALLAYFGPTCGTIPMVYLVRAAGWRLAMALPGILAAGALLGIAALARGAIKPAVTGQTFAPLLHMLRNGRMWLLCTASSTAFGAYYALLTQIGQKSLTDCCAVTAPRAAAVMMLLTILVAAGNLGVNALLKLCGGRRKAITLFGALCTLAGALAGYAAFRQHLGLAAAAAAFVLIAIPAGFFPLFGTIARELNPPQVAGLAVALLNFFAFVFIAAFQNVAGAILHYYHPLMTGLAFPPQAYAGIFLFLAGMAALGLAAAAPLPETRPPT